jgi:hypothetical protein
MFAAEENGNKRTATEKNCFYYIFSPLQKNFFKLFLPVSIAEFLEVYDRNIKSLKNIFLTV